MNYHNIYIVLYLFSSIALIFAALGLGKYFCVRVLYDWYDTLDEFCEKLLPVYIVGAVLVSVVDFLSLYMRLDWLTLVSSVVMMLGLVVFFIFVTIFGIIGIAHKAVELHQYIKYKKNM